jgi:hypothetical protein
LPSASVSILPSCLPKIGIIIRSIHPVVVLEVAEAVGGRRGRFRGRALDVFRGTANRLVAFEAFGERAFDFDGAVEANGQLHVFMG